MKVFMYLFQHKRYKEIKAFYNEAVGELELAYNIWADHIDLPRKKNFKERIFVAEHISEIREVAVWIKTYADILKNKKTAFNGCIIRRGSLLLRNCNMLIISLLQTMQGK